MNFDLDRLVRASIKDLKPYSSARDEYSSGENEMVFLDANENPFGAGLNRYPDPRQRSLKQLLGPEKGVLEEQILLGNGSDEVLDLIFRAFCEPNQDNIITVPPTYGMYKVLAGINAVENREVLLSPDFELDVPGILHKADGNTKALFVCSPNNPTGNAFRTADIEELLRQFSGLIVVDEAYIHFTEQAGWITKLKDYPNLLVTQTFSKAFGMAGIRLGVVYASKEIISVLNKIKPPYNVNALTQQQALTRLKGTAEVANQVEEIKRERKELFNKLQRIPFIHKVYPTDANFILAKVDDADRRYQQLLRMGIVVRNRSSQPLCESTLRFTIGTKEENQKLLNALAQL